MKTHVCRDTAVGEQIEVILKCYKNLMARIVYLRKILLSDGNGNQ